MSHEDTKTIKFSEIVNQKGGISIIIDGYFYNKNKTTESGHTYYDCDHKKSKCEAKVIIDTTVNKIIKHNLLHNHDIPDNKITKLNFINQIKTEIRGNPSLKPVKVFATHLKNHIGKISYFRLFSKKESSKK